MKFTLFVTILFTVAFRCVAIDAVKLNDEQLRAQIVGIWFTEELPELTRHVAQRMQYFPNGRFIGDFRISGPGSEKYIRSLGIWSVKDGEFAETAEQTSDPAIKFPSFFRYVIAIDDKHMILGTEDGSRAEYWRGKGPLESSTPTVSSVDHKELLKELLAMHVSGYRDVPDGKGAVSFRLDSRKIENPPHP
jgi:hypothetical protein